MNDAGPVSRRQRGANLLYNFGHQLGSQGSRPVDELGQGLAIGPFEGEIVEPVSLAVVVGSDDARVAHPGTIFGFSKESLHCDWILGQSRAQDFDGCHASLGVLGAVNCGGSALADVLGKVVSRDGPAGQRVAVHEVAKLVNSSGRSKLNALALVLDASPAASLTFAFLQWSPLCPRFTWENSCAGW